MVKFDYLEPDLRSCKLCEWRCGVDRLAENIRIEDKKIKTGVCGSTVPKVASSQLHPAPPASYDAFLAGCNFRCLFCQNWSVSMFDENNPDSVHDIEGYYPPMQWAELALASLTSDRARLINADRLFFTGGEPTCALPWVEEVVNYAHQIIPDTKVNYDTNGFLTKDSLNRVLEFTTSITFDVKAFNPELFKILTGANVKPVLRNLKFIIKNALEKLWEIRVMVIPGVHEQDVPGLCKFLADINPGVNLNFLAFRPNFIMEEYFGATDELLEYCISTAYEYGLKNVSWSGLPNISGYIPKKVEKIIKNTQLPKNIALPTGFKILGGCDVEPRNCGTCVNRDDCSIKKYIPKRIL